MVSVQRLRIGSLGLALVLALGAAGCGDGDDDDNDKVYDGNAREHCIALSEILCERLLDCFEQEGLLESSDRPAAEEECGTSWMGSLDCDRAVAVKESYDECIDLAPEISCEALVNTPETAIPESCRGVIQVQ